MRSHDEFKEILNQKKMDYEKTRRFRRGKLISAGICLVLCAALITAYLTRPLSVHAQDLMAGIIAKPVPGTVTDDRFVENQMRFSVELLKACQNGDNLLISPLSVSLALSMAANGAVGQTRAEMEALLAGNMSIKEFNRYLKYYINHLPSGDDSKFSAANSIWFRDDDRLSVNQAFLQTNADYYGADAYCVPFDDSTVTDINSWVSNHTDGLIKQIITDIDSSAMLYLINTLLFDAKWESVYDTNHVKNSTFTAADGTVRDVEMMYGEGYGYLEDANARGFMKDYVSGYRFVALLPNEGVTLEEYIAGLSWEGLLEMLQDPQDRATYSGLPKFEYECDLMLKDVLTGLGMGTAFDAALADFTRMGTLPEGSLYLGEVLHKTYIQVAEQGTKAGAVSAVNLPGSGALLECERIVLDRPFLYLIVDTETSLPIFMGTVNDIP